MKVNTSMFVVAGLIMAMGGAVLADAPPDVAVVRPRRATVADRLTLVGTVTPFEQADVCPQVTGALLRYNVDLGDHVKAGDVLAELDPRLAEVALHEAEGRFKVQRQAWIAAKGTMQRTQAFLDRLRSKYQADDPRLLPTSRPIRGSIQARIEDAQNAAADAEAQMALAQARVERAKLDLEATHVTAPISGVISARKAQIGSLVPPNGGPETALFTVEQIDVVRVWADMIPTDAERVRAGMPAEIAAMQNHDSPAQHFQGELKRLAPRVDAATGMRPVEIDVPNEHEWLLPGMAVRIGLNLQAHPNSLTVPLAAVGRAAGQEGNQPVVYIVSREGRVAETPIKVGLIDAVNVEVIDGIDEGALVIADAARAPRPGTVVQPIEKP